MNKLFIVFLLCLIDFYSQAQNIIIAKGEVRGPFIWKSKIYPGTERNYWVYVPKQYDASKASCLMVVQDGLSRATGWNLTPVLDSLIASKQIPVMIGVFIDQGRVHQQGAGWRGLPLLVPHHRGGVPGRAHGQGLGLGDGRRRDRPADAQL